MYDIEEEMLYGKSKLLEEMKKNTGMCPECGKMFEQGFYIDQNTGEKRFNKFKYCPKCRTKIAKKNEGNKTTNVTIKYNPYPWQKKFHASKARFKVVSGAARSGKDYSFDCILYFDYGITCIHYLCIVGTGIPVHYSNLWRGGVSTWLLRKTN